MNLVIKSLFPENRSVSRKPVQAFVDIPYWVGFIGYHNSYSLGRNLHENIVQGRICKVIYVIVTTELCLYTHKIVNDSEVTKRENNNFYGIHKHYPKKNLV